jgi:hypothetical protein
VVSKYLNTFKNNRPKYLKKTPTRHSKPKLEQIIFETKDKFDKLVYFFLVGGCARIYKILERNATSLLAAWNRVTNPIGYLE